MKQETAWRKTVMALRLHFLQGNSHISGIDEWIDEQVVETLEAIRRTNLSKHTATMVGEVEGRGV